MAKSKNWRSLGSILMKIETVSYSIFEKKKKYLARNEFEIESNFMTLFGSVINKGNK